MPQKNSHKIYYADGYYHVYNRGVEKRNIFEGEKDYAVFLHLLRTALVEPEKIKQENETLFSLGLNNPKLQGSTLQKFIFHPRENFYGRINLICYCLMQNHYHLLIQQKDVDALSEFMKSIITAYSMYFNKKYERVGPLFQGSFKAVDIQNETYFLWLSRYIHRNPINFLNYSFSSYQDYIGNRNTEWVNKDLLQLQGSTLQDQIQKYRGFVESGEKQFNLENLTLED
ncbi:MAG: transposase [bacterium]|nr:transposase [bacterium]